MYKNLPARHSLPALSAVALCAHTEKQTKCICDSAAPGEIQDNRASEANERQQTNIYYRCLPLTDRRRNLTPELSFGHFPVRNSESCGIPGLPALTQGHVSPFLCSILPANWFRIFYLARRWKFCKSDLVEEWNALQTQPEFLKKPEPNAGSRRAKNNNRFCRRNHCVFSIYSWFKF